MEDKMVGTYRTYSEEKEFVYARGANKSLAL
jgi:hypothetical protein